MDSNYSHQLFALVSSPAGIVGIVFGLLLTLYARKSRALAWFLFTLCCFSASLAKFRDQYVEEPPALVFPLQQIRDFGRPLSVVFLGLLLLTIVKKPSWRRQLLAEPIKYLIAVQGVIFFKTLTSGNLAFSFMAALIFGTVIQVVRLGPSYWLQDNKNFTLAARSIALAGSIFVVFNLYQAAIDIYPITFVHGRFLGTTGNPQHAAALLSSTMPCFIFLFESHQHKWVKGFWIVNLLFVGLLLFMTGSRTGVLMAIATILFFYRNKGAALVRLGIVVAVVSAIVFPFISHDGFLLGADQAGVSTRFLSAENNRSEVWTALWRGFSQNPIFGVPLEGSRLGFGESSWLAAGSALGLVGLIPLSLFGVACLRMMSQLATISKQQPGAYLQCSTVISGLACLLVGSFFEAFLLGNISFALLTLLTYLSLGQYLIELCQAQKKSYSQSQLTASYLVS